MTRTRVLTVLALSAALSACGGRQQEAAGPRAGADGLLRYGEVVFEPCSLSAANRSVEAQCASIEVPENHDEPDGRRITLSLALVPAEGMAEPDPVFMIAGGPGQSAQETYPMAETAFRDVNRTRHVLLLDARGTGRSNPLHCRPDGEDETLFTDVAGAAASIRVFAERCRDELSKSADLRYYTTGDHVRDLDFVRRRLGVDRVNLVGISYGTRVAQQFAATYPQHTRTVVLDSVVPNTLVLGQEHARNLEAALESLFERCRADAGCRGNLGDPRELLATVRARLQAGGIPPVDYRDPVSGEWRREVPRFGHLAGLMRLYAYVPEMAATLPLVLHEAAQGRYEGLLAQSRMLSRSVGDSIALGMSLSVSCSEDADDLRRDPADDATVMGNDLVDMLTVQCEVWPRGTRAQNFREPLAGDLPLLALSGEFDPVTPPRYGDEVVATLPNARHIVLPGQGHNVIGIGCMPKLLAQFIETADAKSLDAACLDRLSAQPPFAGYYGWEP